MGCVIMGWMALLQFALFRSVGSWSVYGQRRYDLRGSVIYGYDGGYLTRVHAFAAS